MRVKVGDKIKHTLFGGEVCTGIVEDMQICRQGEKYNGRYVKSADVSKYHGVIDLQEHWCYFDQVIKVLEK